MAGVDAELEVYAREIRNALKPVEGGRFDLELPPDAAAYFFRREGGRPYYVIWGPGGELVDQSDPEIQAGKSGTAADGRREKSFQAAGGATVLIGRDVTDLRRAEWGLVVNVALAGFATLAVAIFGGWFVAGRALAPIDRISRTARAMSEGDLNARIAVEQTESELEQVASTLNTAFDRLRLVVEQERRFIADASHELRTPLSVLRAETEWALDRDRSAHEYKGALTVGWRAALRMQDIVERLLALVRADVAPDERDFAPVSIRPLIEDVAGWLAPMAQARSVQLSVCGPPLTVHGDAEQLREALNNVVANAIVYNKCRGGGDDFHAAIGWDGDDRSRRHGHRYSCRSRAAGVRSVLSSRQSAIAGDRRLRARSCDCAHDSRRPRRQHQLHERARRRFHVRDFSPGTDAGRVSLFSYLTVMKHY